MASQAHLTVVRVPSTWTTQPSPIAPARKRHNSNKGRKFPPDPIKPEEFAILLANCVPLTPGRQGELSAMRLRALLVVLYRTGLRISEALALYDFDLNREQRSIVVRNGKGGKRRIVLVDEWGWREIEHWLTVRHEIPEGALFPVIRGEGAGNEMTSPDVRRQLAQLKKRCGMHRRLAPHQFRHGFAVDASREGIPLYSLQGQLGHARLDVTERYLRGIDPMERLAPFGARRAPMIVIPGPDHAA